MARTLDIIGDRWTILILRDLVLGGNVKFTDFLRSLQGISPNLLAARLKQLESEGIVERCFYSNHPPRAEYCFTEKGRELGAVIRAIGEWGHKHQLTGAERSSWVPPWLDDVPVGRSRLPS